MSHTTVQFNVGGKIFAVEQSLLLKFDDRMMLRVAAEMADTTEDDIFIDRDGERFAYILDYMRYGKVHLPLSISKGSFLSDLLFYGLQVKEDHIIVSGSCASQLQLCIKRHHERLRLIELERQCRLYAKACLDHIIARSIADMTKDNDKTINLYSLQYFQATPLNEENGRFISDILAEYGFIEIDFGQYPTTIKSKFL